MLSPSNPSLTHISYALLTSRATQALKDAASIKCKASLPTSADGADAFAETLDLAYENAVALQGLCKYLVTFALDNSEVGVSAQFHPALKKVMQKHPELAMNVTEAMHVRLMEKPDLSPNFKIYSCPACGELNAFRQGTLHIRVQYRCRDCNDFYSGERWMGRPMA